MHYSIIALIALFSLLLCGCPHEDDHTHNNPNHHQEDSGLRDVEMDVALEIEQARAYCECMLVNCHDPWHLKHGDDDVDAMNDCIIENAALPHLGSPQTSGNSIECRQHFCDQSNDEPNNCADALGPGCSDD